MPNVLGNHSHPNTEDKQACTQDNLKNMYPNELSYYLRDALHFSIKGGEVEIKISPKLIIQLSWHPYLSALFSHFNLIEISSKPVVKQLDPQNANPTETDAEQFSSIQRRFYDAIQQLKAQCALGTSIRDHSLFLIDSAGKMKNNFIAHTILHPNPFALAQLRDTVEKAAELQPTDVSIDSVFMQLQEYQLLVVTEKAHLLEEVVHTLEWAIEKLKDILEDIAAKQRDSLFQMGCKAYEEYHSILHQWDKIKHRPEVEFQAKSEHLKIKVDTDVLKFLNNLRAFSTEFNAILSAGIGLKEPISHEGIALFMENTASLFHDLSIHCYQKADDYIKRLNTGNITNPGLKSLLEEVEQTIENINEKQLLKHKIETNTRNFYQFYHSLYQHFQRLKRALVFSKSYPEIMAWKAFTEKLDTTSVQILEALKPMPASIWVETFDQAARELFFERWQHPAALNDRLIQLAGYSMMARWKSNAREDIIQFSDGLNQNQPVSNSVFKRVSQWFNTNSSSKDLSEPAKRSGQFTISLDESMGNEVSVRMGSESQETKVLDLEISCLDSIAQLNKLNKRIDDYAITDRFAIAKTVADSILELGCETRVFQLKGANILCLLPKPLSNAMCIDLDDLGIKEFQGRTSHQDAIIESIIETRRKQVLILFNGLPNDNRLDCFEEQILLLEKIKTLGFISHSIWSNEIIEKGGKNCFDDLKQVLSF